MSSSIRILDDCKIKYMNENPEEKIIDEKFDNIYKIINESKLK
jgi:hypothetical protein